jgi:phage tail-like protein
MAVMRETPYGAFNYLVSLGDQDPESVQAGFSEVSGLGVTVDVIEYRNGNEKENHPRKLPGLHRTSNVVLERGIIGDLGLFQWLKQVMAGDVAARRTVTISMLDESRSETVLTFRLVNAWPCRWEGPTLAANGRDVAIETLELCHEGLEVE